MCQRLSSCWGYSGEQNFKIPMLRLIHFSLPAPPRIYEVVKSTLRKNGEL